MLSDYDPMYLSPLSSPPKWWWWISNPSTDPAEENPQHCHGYRLESPRLAMYLYSYWTDIMSPFPKHSLYSCFDRLRRIRHTQPTVRSTVRGWKNLISTVDVYDESICTRVCIYCTYNWFCKLLVLIVIIWPDIEQHYFTTTLSRVEFVVRACVLLCLLSPFNTSEYQLQHGNAGGGSLSTKKHLLQLLSYF